LLSDDGEAARSNRSLLSYRGRGERKPVKVTWGTALNGACVSYRETAGSNCETAEEMVYDRGMPFFLCLEECERRGPEVSGCQLYKGKCLSFTEKIVKSVGSGGEQCAIAVRSCVWGDWQAWGDCDDVSCKQHRKRDVLVEADPEGDECKGDPEQEEDCACPIEIEAGAMQSPFLQVTVLFASLALALLIRAELLDRP